MENEICPILVGIVDTEPVINREEVEAVEWRDWRDFLDEIQRGTRVYSEWCVEQAGILQRTPQFKELI